MKKRYCLLTFTCSLFNSRDLFAGYNPAKRFDDINNACLYHNVAGYQSFVWILVNSHLLQEVKTASWLKFDILSPGHEGQAQFIKSLADKYVEIVDLIMQLKTNFHLIIL